MKKRPGARDADSAQHTPVTVPMASPTDTATAEVSVPIRLCDRIGADLWCGVSNNQILRSRVVDRTIPTLVRAAGFRPADKRATRFPDLFRRLLFAAGSPDLIHRGR